SCPTNRTLALPAGQCQLALPDLTGELAATDNCCCVTILQSPAPGTLLNIGLQTLTFTVTDSMGLSTTCIANVTVADVTPPVIVCPANITAQCTGPAGTVVTYSVSATDCDPTPSLGCLPASGSTFAIGSTLVTCTASDMSGNTTNCMFTVNVVVYSANYVENVTVPDNNANGLARTRTFASPIGIITDVNVTLHLSGGFNGDLYAYVVHESGYAVLLNRVGRRAGDPLGYGDAGMDVTLDDQAGNGDIHNYRLTLFGTHSTALAGPLTNSWAPDGRATDPALVLNTDARTELLSSFNGLNPNGEWTLYIADLSPLDTATLVSWGLEVCGLPPVPASITQDPQSQMVACSSTVNFTIAASGTAPLTNRWYRNGTEIPGATGTTLTLNGVSVANAGTYFAVVRNMGGSATSAPAMLTVIDMAPSILCPGPTVVECTSPAGAVAAFTVSVTDDCTPGLLPVCVPPSGSLFPPGMTTVNCSATDSATNVSTCSFTVRVVDTTPPALCVNPPSTLLAGGQDNFAGPEPATPSVNLQTRLTGLDLRGFDDALTDAWLGHTVSNLSMFAVEVTLRIRMRAVSGLPQNDTIILGFAGPGGALRPEQWTRYLGHVNGVDNGLYGGQPWSNATNEFVLNLAALPNRTGPTTDLVGAIRRYGYLDIMVQDDTAIDYVSVEVRSCQCRPDIEQPSAAGFCGATVNFQTPVFTDACDANVSVVCNPPSGTFFPIGSTLIVCTATDDSGNSNHCAFSVSITEPPPRITVSRQGANLVICWPATCAPYLLEQTSSLNSPLLWTPVMIAPIVNGNQYCVPVPIQPGNKFFRLRRY
ncbi:MAG TPA: HYR domain-containing protein, partial [Verrucomicrobiae bacterium]|nr:HYR domain-containing protein [Verrucomicrobiae bacterium]